MYLRSLGWGGVIATAFVSAAWLGCTPAPLSQSAPLGGGGSSSGDPGTGGGLLGFDGGGMGPPAADAGGLCGNQIQKLITNPPNVYFVLDTSGSMATPVSGGSRYQVVQSAATKVVSNLHLLIKAGAATFPGASDQCAAGHEVFPLTLDDPTGFNNATKGISPFGGTPTASTLQSLVPKLSQLADKTVVVLATDGGPNCNAEAACDAGGCMENIEGCSPGDTCCADNQNCCAANGPAGPLNCVDQQASVDAVKALAAAGVRVYVIGIPGSQAYGQVLSAMALAGGAPLASYPFYYKVDNLDTIISVLGAAAGAALSCDFTLTDPPMDPSDTNVYLDQTVVLADPVDGWTWSASGVVTLHGASCAKLQSGAVSQVQIVSGCPTMSAQ